MKISVYLPCRAGSERIKNKNTREFYQGKSLLQHKLSTLVNIDKIHEVCVSTNDDMVIEQVESFGSKKVKIFRRQENLCRSDTRTDDLVADMLKICRFEHLLWTHVTSPFLNARTYSDIISAYFDKDGYDSLMTVTNHQTFMWFRDKPLNFDRSKVRWPNTQTLESVWEANSGAFMVDRKTSELYNDRIGKAPLLFETKYPQNLDIDWPEDFENASSLIRTIMEF